MFLKASFWIPVFLLGVNFFKLTLQECVTYYEVKAGDTCYEIAKRKNLCLNSIFEWNEGIKCDNLQIGQKICIAHVPDPEEPVSPNRLKHLSASELSVCTNHYKIKTKDTCWELALHFGPYLYRLPPINPGFACDKLKIGDVICASTVASENITACAEFHYIKSGDSCRKIMELGQISTDTLWRLNPNINCDNLRPGKTVCLSSMPRDKPAAIPKTVSFPLPPLSTSAPSAPSAPPAPPSPSAPSAPSARSAPVSLPSSTACNNFRVIQSGDICWDIAIVNNITLDQLLNLNPGLNCNNLQIGQKVCLPEVSGKASPAPQSTPPEVVDQNRCLNNYKAKEPSSCWLIAQRTGLQYVEDVTDLNPGLNCNNPVPSNTKVCVNRPNVMRCSLHHIVRHGENIHTIARRYGYVLNVLKLMNNGEDLEDLTVGQAICIRHYMVRQCTKKANAKSNTLPRENVKSIGGYFTNWDFYNTNKNFMNINRISLFTQVMYAFLSISYSYEYDVWYVDTNDPSADFFLSKLDSNDCMSFSKDLECDTGTVSLIPYVGAGSETKRCPESTCFNSGGQKEFPRKCHTKLLFQVSNGKARVCGQMNHLLNELYKKAPDTSVLFTIGGWYDSNYWTKAVSPKYVDQFITSIISWLDALPFDGVDINWEHPGHEHEGQPLPGHSMKKGNPDFIRNCTEQKCDEESRVDDYQNLWMFIEKLRNRLSLAGPNSNGLNRHGTPYEISIAVSAIPSITRPWNIHKICDKVTRINLMTYDYVGGWSQSTGYQSPLYTRDKKCDWASGANSVACSVEFWIRNGCPREKIIIGVPSYARIFKNVSFGGDLRFPGYHQTHAGLHNQSILGYQKVLQDPQFQHYWDRNSMTSFSYSRSKAEFATYDNPQAVREKAKWVKDQELGGMMLWKMGEDDLNDDLVNEIREEFFPS